MQKEQKSQLKISKQNHKMHLLPKTQWKGGAKKQKKRGKYKINTNTKM